MFYDAKGQPDPNGDFEIINGSLILRDGRRIGSSCYFMDAHRDAKPDEPKSIDEALSQQFKLLAERDGTDVKTWLAKTPQKQIEEIASQVAATFVSARAGHGIAKQFSKDKAMITNDAELEYRLAAARAKHEMMYPDRPFTEDQAADVIRRHTAKRARTVADSAVSDTNIADARSYYEGARAAYISQMKRR